MKRFLKEIMFPAIFKTLFLIFAVFLLECAKLGTGIKYIKVFMLLKIRITDIYVLRYIIQVRINKQTTM